jgi:hypothetical protein
MLVRAALTAAAEMLSLQATVLSYAARHDEFERSVRESCREWRATLDKPCVRVLSGCVGADGICL